jgi:hypothetical protein
MPKKTPTTNHTTVLMNTTNTNTYNNLHTSKILHKVNSYPDIGEVLEQSLNSPSTTLESTTLSNSESKEVQR